MPKSAGLLRAHAVLRQLELLRQQDVLDPMPNDTDTDASSGGIHADEVNSTNYQLTCGALLSPSSLRRKQQMREPKKAKEEQGETGDMHSVRGSSKAGAAFELLSVPASYGAPLHERNKMLQHMLQGIVDLRLKKARGKETRRNGTQQEGQLNRAEGVGITPEHAPRGGRSKLPHHSPSRLLSPSRDGNRYDSNEGHHSDSNRETSDGDNVFFDDPFFSAGGLTYDARDGEHKTTLKNAYLSHPRARSIVEGKRGSRYDVPQAEQQEIAFIPHKSQHNSHKKSRHSVNSPVVGDYAKSLIQQHKSREKKLMDEITGRQGRWPMENRNSTESLRRMEATPPSAALSPIICVDDAEGTVSPFTGHRIDFDDMCDEYSYPPLMSYIHDLATMGSAELQKELEGMKNCGDDEVRKKKNNTINTSSGSINNNNNNNNNNTNNTSTSTSTSSGSGSGSGSSELRCREWFALTALVNAPDAIRHIIVPLLLSELIEHSGPNDYASSDIKSRVSLILCALIGLGELAVASLPTLLEMLITRRGVAKLVALAIRSVGGDDGLHALCRIARNRKDPRVRSVAIYGISALTNPVLGSTTVYCLSTTGLRETVVFYQPPVTSGYIEVGSQRGEPLREMSLQRPPPYRPTDVLLHAEIVRQQLLHFTSSSLFRRPTRAYAVLPLVLHDFAKVAVEVAHQQDMPDTILIALHQYASELDSVSSLPPRVLPFSYDPHYTSREDELFAVEKTLMTVLLDSHTPPPVVEQSLVSLASLPNFATTHVAPPLLDFVVQRVAHFEQRCADMNVSGEKIRSNKRHRNKAEYRRTVEIVEDEDEGEDNGVGADVTVLVAALVALGRIVRAEGTSPLVTDAASEVLMHNLVSLSLRLRHAACIGLGEIGVMSNNTELIAQSVNDCLNDGAMNHETVAWALARLGQEGISLLLDRIASGSYSHESNFGVLPLSVSTRVVCVRALAMVDLLVVSLGVPDVAHQLREELIQRLSTIIAENNMEDDVLLECVYAIAEIIGNRNSNNTDSSIGNSNENADSAPTVSFAGHRHDEAAVYYRSELPNEAFEVLKSLLESSNYSFSVQQALFFSLCAYGGAHGELYACQTAIQCPITVSRAAATFGLRACGGKVIRTLAVALNDDAADVRLEAFDTLTAIGADAVLTVLRTRPQQHTRQVIAALRDCLLRDLCRNAKQEVAQELYRAMTQSRVL